MKKNKGYIFLFLTILSTAFIFFQSLQTAKESTEISGVFIDFILNLLNTEIENITFIVRKAAHMAEFFIQSTFMMHSIKYLSGNTRKHINTVLLTGILTAVTDETIQLFVEGRSGQVSDIIIDFSGTLIGVILFVILSYIIKRKKGDLHNV